MNQSEVSAVLVGSIVNDERTMREMESLNNSNLRWGEGVLSNRDPLDTVVQ